MPRTRTQTKIIDTPKAASRTGSAFQNDKIVWGLITAYLAGLVMYGVMGIMVNPPALHPDLNYLRSSAAELSNTAPALVAEQARTAAPELVRNGSFEMPVIRAASQFVNGSAANLGWTVSWTNDRPRQMALTRQPGIEILAAFQGWKAAHGQQFVRMDSADLGGRAAAAQSLVTLTQTVDTVARTPYMLSLYVSPQPKTAKQENQISVTWNGEEVGSISLDGSKAATPQWQKYTFPVVGTGNDVIGIIGQGPENRQGMLVDAVSVTPAPQTK